MFFGFPQQIFDTVSGSLYFLLFFFFIIIIFREAQQGTIDIGRLTGWLSLFYEGVQLSSFAFMDNFEFTSNDESPMVSIKGFETVFMIINYLTLKITEWLPIVLFVVFWIIIMFAAVWTGVLSNKLPPFINTVIWDMMYIPAMRSFVEVMVCTYRCSYFQQPESFQPYPSLDMMPSISCFSVGYNFWLVAAILGVAFLHPLALNFVAFKKNDSDPAMRLLPRFNVVFYVGKVFI